MNEDQVAAVSGGTEPAWGGEEEGAISVPAFEALIEELYAQNRKVKAMQETVDAENEVLSKLKAKVMHYMEEFGKDKYSSNFGTISVQNKFSVQVPKDLAMKQQFFEWLKAKEIFENVITVHSATLNSLYNSLLEESGNPDFEIPGVGKGTHYKILSIRSK